MKLKGAWKSRFSGLFNRAKKAPELSSSVVKRDKMDDGVLDDMIERARLFRDTHDNQPVTDLDNLVDSEGNPIALTDQQRGRAEEYVAWGDLFSDVFRALHTYDEPELLPENEIKPSRELNRRIMDQIVHNENFQKLRPDTRHSSIESAFTAISMADGLSQTLNTELQEFVVRAKEMNEMEEKLGPPGGIPDPNGQGGSGTGNGQGGGSGGSKKNPIFDPKTGRGTDPNDPNNQTGNQQQQGPAQMPTSQQQQQAQGGGGSSLDQIAQDLANAAAQQQQQGLGTSVMEAIDHALQEGKDSADAIANLPGYGEGSEKRMSPDQMIELAQKWRETPQLRNIARMTGRLQRDMRQKRARRIVGGNEEIVDVTVGDDLALTLPHELALLNHPLAKLEFQRKYHEKALLEYETEGTDSAGNGPVVIVIDGSGSMSGMNNEWARSVALALITIARREKRDAMAVEFSSGGQVKAWEFLKKDTPNPVHVLDFVTHFFGGGTEIASGMLVAQEFINTRPEFRKADIVLIGDGGDYFDDGPNGRDRTMRDELVAKGVRVHGVSIGFDAESNDYFKKMCDDVVGAYDMAGGNEATDHLAQAIT